MTHGGSPPEHRQCMVGSLNSKAAHVCLLADRPVRESADSTCRKEKEMSKVSGE
jgi:hypothetical protein